MGVDYSGHGTIIAIGAGQISSIHNAGWPNGTFIEERLSTSPYAGKDWYYAEDITPTVQPGQTVTAGEPLGQMFQGPDGIETGWSVGTGGTTLAAIARRSARGDAARRSPRHDASRIPVRSANQPRRACDVRRRPGVVRKRWSTSRRRPDSSSFLA